MQPVQNLLLGALLSVIGRWQTAPCVENCRLQEARPSVEGLAVYDHCFDCFDREDEHFTPFYFSLDVNHDTHVYIEPHMSHTYVLVNTFVDNSPSQVWSWSISRPSMCQTIPWMMIFCLRWLSLFFFGASCSY